MSMLEVLRTDGELYLGQKKLYRLRKPNSVLSTVPEASYRIAYPAKSETKVECDVEELAKVTWGEGVRCNSFMAFLDCVL